MTKTVSRPFPAPLLIIDGDCAFCRRWGGRLTRWTGVRVKPYQEVAGRFPEISVGDFRSSVRLVEPSGKILAGAAAALRTLAYKRGWGWIYGLYRRVPLFSWASEKIYHLVARHRYRL